MQRTAHLLLALCMLASLTGFEVSAAAQSDDVLDLADIPLPVQALPEDGYQVMSGGYLTHDDVAALVAGPRSLDQEQVLEQVNDIDVNRAYVLDAVLPEDRAWQNSPALAVVQTSVYVVNEDGSEDWLIELLQNFANTAFVDARDPAIDGAYTIAMVGEGGDQLRTIFSDGRVVVEIVSMDTTGAPDEIEHILIVEATLERLTRIREDGDAGLSSMAMTLLPGAGTAAFAHTQQSGVHGLYRYRDSGIQPAIGEISAEEEAVAPGMQSLYVGSEMLNAGGGTGVASVWLGEFDSSNSASAFFETLIAGSPGNILADPFFIVSGDESWTEQGVLGVYRVTGTYRGQSYSGNVEIRQSDNIVVAVGYRSVGAALPSTDITSAMMDHQLDCLEGQQVCPYFDLADATPPPQATPVVDTGAPDGSEFGWSLPELGSDWTITEQFSEQGYDRIGIHNGMSIFEIESIINHHGDPVQCVLDELHLLQEFEQHSDIRLWEDANGNTEGGNSPTQAWAVYRVEPLAEERADQEYVIRIDCFSLLPDTANLVIRHIAPVDFWVEEQPKGDFLRESIILPEGFSAHGKITASTHDRRTTMILTHWIDRAA